MIRPGNDAAAFEVDVVTGTRERQLSERVPVTAGECVAAVLERCTLVDALPAAERGDLVPAIYGQRVPPDTLIRPGDRLELLRPLRVDPKEARRRRAARRDD